MFTLYKVEYIKLLLKCAQLHLYLKNEDGIYYVSVTVVIDHLDNSEFHKKLFTDIGHKMKAEIDYSNFMELLKQTEYYER